MQTSEVIYEGNLRTRATHTKSGSSFITDAPTDNNGKGEAFSPTDLVATALASCMQTVMGIYAAKNQLSFEHAEMKIEKVMAANPRRISKIRIHFDWKTEEPQEVIDTLKEVAINCPVAKSLHPDIKQEVTFNIIN
jgi:putative redox protein